MKKQNQRELVKKHLKKHGSITAVEAFKWFGIMRLSSVIFDLRQDGMKIKTEYESSKNRYGYHVTYARYKLVK